MFHTGHLRDAPYCSPGVYIVPAALVYAGKVRVVIVYARIDDTDFDALSPVAEFPHLWNAEMCDAFDIVW